MRHKNKGEILDRGKQSREMMLRNMASSIIIYEKIKTTQAKAKVVKPLVEKIITLAKKNKLSSTKNIYSILPQKMAVKKSVEMLANRYKDKKGGYTRTTKIGQRKGDGAEMVLIELI